MNRKPRARKRRAAAKSARARERGAPATSIRDRLREAESTLEAIRTGRVDAVVVSGPKGEQTLTIDGAAHPYFVLLHSMGDGAVLLEPGGAILFGNRSFGKLTGVQVDALRGSSLQRFVAAADRPRFAEFLRAGSKARVVAEFTLATRKGSTRPVSIALSTLPLTTNARAKSSSAGDATVLMGIVTDLSERKASEATRNRLLERLISAEDQERRRVARELHDETGQSLTAILVGLRAIADMPMPPDVRPVAIRLRDVAALTVADVGRLARGLHPAVLDDQGLATASRSYVGDYIESFGTPVDFVAGELDSPRLPPMVAATMYRLLQESLTNVARHARAGKVSVELSRHDSMLELQIRDNGVGFDVSRARAKSGLGLRGMFERVTLLGGSLEIESRPGRGTVLRARVPANIMIPSAPPIPQA